MIKDAKVINVFIASSNAIATMNKAALHINKWFYNYKIIKTGLNEFSIPFFIVYIVLFILFGFQLLLVLFAC